MDSIEKRAHVQSAQPGAGLQPAHEHAQVFAAVIEIGDLGLQIATHPVIELTRRRIVRAVAGPDDDKHERWLKIIHPEFRPAARKRWRLRSVPG